MTAMVKRHVVRISVKGQGYKLYAGTTTEGFTEQPLDIPSKFVSAAYIKAQARLDRILATDYLPWSLTIVYDSASPRPVVAYGTFLDTPDDTGRPGLYFIHGVEVHDVRYVPACVGCVVRLLSNTGVRTRSFEIARVALGHLPVQDFLRSVCEDFDKVLVDLDLPTLYSRLPSDLAISAIEHDCGGASAVAWLTMAVAQSAASPPWEVYDSLTAGGTVRTHRTNDDSGRVIKASDILGCGVSYYRASDLRADEIPVKPTFSVSSTQAEDSQTCNLLLKPTGTDRLSLLEWGRKTLRVTSYIVVFCFAFLIGQHYPQFVQLLFRGLEESPTDIKEGPPAKTEPLRTAVSPPETGTDLETKSPFTLSLEPHRPLTLNSVAFDSGKTEMRVALSGELEELIRILKENPAIEIELHGHTDDRGNRETNLRLSIDRADAVKNYLIGKGIAENQISTQGFGPDKPILQSKTPEARRINRRVEVVRVK